MSFSNKKGFQRLLCLLILLYKCCAAKSTTKELDIKDKVMLSETDLLRNYETLSRNAVSRDTAIVLDMRSQKDKYVSINNGQDFNIFINDNIMSRPIGTYQYIDANGDLHIVNFINDANGLRILNDYKPYVSPQSTNKLKTIQSNDLKPKNSEKQSKGKTEFLNGKHSVGDESNKDINYDEYEFTFMPQEINKSMDRNNNKINDLNSDESNKNIDKLSANEEPKKLVQNNDKNYHQIHRLTQMMNSMPNPFSVPNHPQHTFYGQIPMSNNDNWRGPPTSRGFTYGVQSITQGFRANFDAKPFLNWNPNY